jgi:hypothetical protein
MTHHPSSVVRFPSSEQLVREEREMKTAVSRQSDDGPQTTEDRGPSHPHRLRRYVSKPAVKTDFTDDFRRPSSAY